jgi:hypothetical protein
MLSNEHHCIPSKLKSIFSCVKYTHLLAGILAIAALGNMSSAAANSSFITLNPQLKTMNTNQGWQQTTNRPGRFWVKDEALL